jgi:hypothetical protein
MSRCFAPRRERYLRLLVRPDIPLFLNVSELLFPRRALLLDPNSIPEVGWLAGR